VGPKSLREHFSGHPTVRVLPPAPRYQDIGDFTAASEAIPAEDALLTTDPVFKSTSVRVAQTSGFSHFLDGSQRTWPVGYIGMGPMFLAHTSAAILRREMREVLPPESDFYSGGLELYVPSFEEYEAPPNLECRTVGTGMGDTEMSLTQKIWNAISARREDRETELARRFRHGMLLIDGGIGKVLEKLPDGVGVVGVVKSHQRSYFASPDRVQIIMNLKAGERSSVFVRPQNKIQGKEAYSCYLRLFDSEGKSPMHGLIRVELPPRAEMERRVDEICGWLLLERGPLSLPDARFDRMLYPIRLAEQHLKARQPSDASIRAILGV
jgi:hypothetical protein